MKLIDYICKASGWTPVTCEYENRPARDITPGSVVDVIVVDPYDDEFRILEKQTVLSVRPTADNDLGHDFVEVLIAADDVRVAIRRRRRQSGLVGSQFLLNLPDQQPRNQRKSS